MSVTGAGALVGVMVVAFLIQRLFGLQQAQDVRKAYAEMYRRRHKTCCVAYGRSKDYLLFKGCMVILAVNPAGKVEEALKLEGRTIFSRIHEAPELAGLDAQRIATQAKAEAEEPRSVRKAHQTGNDRVPREERLLKRAVVSASQNAMEYMSKLATTAC